MTKTIDELVDTTGWSRENIPQGWEMVPTKAEYERGKCMFLLVTGNLVKAVTQRPYSEGFANTFSASSRGFFIRPKENIEEQGVEFEVVALPKGYRLLEPGDDTSKSKYNITFLADDGSLGGPVSTNLTAKQLTSLNHNYLIREERIETRLDAVAAGVLADPYDWHGRGNNPYGKGDQAQFSSKFSVSKPVNVGVTNGNEITDLDLLCADAGGFADYSKKGSKN